MAKALKKRCAKTRCAHGWRLLRDAALSLALTHPFAGELANPRQMTAFTYDGSPAVLSDDPAFTGGPRAGAIMPETKLDSGFLSDRLVRGFTVLCFDAELAKQIKSVFAGKDQLTVVSLPLPSRVSEIFAAASGSAYLVRPDMHIAGRWYTATAQNVIDGYRLVTFQEAASR